MHGSFPPRAGSGTSPTPYSPPQLDPRTSQELFKQCAQEIISGTEHSPETIKLAQCIRTHLHEQLKPRKLISPGLFSTGFSHLAQSDGTAIIPDNLVFLEDEAIFQAVLTKSLEHAENNAHGTPPSDAITLNQVMNGLPPTQGKPLLPPNVAVHGTDALGNKVAVLLGGHKNVSELAQATKLHHAEPLYCGSDNWAWGRAAWMSILVQRSPEDLGKDVESMGSDFNEAAQKIKALASALQTKGPDAVIELTPSSSTEKATFSMRWPEGVAANASPSNCETILKKVTDALMAKSLSSPELNQLPNDAPIENAKILLLTSLLGGDAAILTNKPAADERSKSNGGKRSICLSQPETDSAIDQLSCLSVRDRLQAVFEHVKSLPLIAQRGDGYSVAFASDPISATKANDGTQSDVASPKVSDDDAVYMDAQETWCTDSDTIVLAVSAKPTSDGNEEGAKADALKNSDINRHAAAEGREKQWMDKEKASEAKSGTQSY